MLLGCLLLLISCGCWLTLTHMTRVGYQYGEMKCPFAVVYIGTLLLIFVYPVYVAIVFIATRGQLGGKEFFM